MVNNERGVEKNVSACTFQGDHAATPTGPLESRWLTFRRLFRPRAGLAAAVFAGALCVGALCTVPAPVLARSKAGSTGTVALASLPPAARETQQRILTGGPFPYAKDGVVFANRERHLARHPRGYYREYTVPSPGARDRGARRIVCGGFKPMEPDACFYTEDHYNSFRRIQR